MEREAFVDKGINLIIVNSLNRYTLYTGLMDVFINNLKTTDMKNIFIEKCKAKWNLYSSQKPSKDGRSTEYKQVELLNNLTKMVFKGYSGLYELNKAIAHFNDYYKENNREIKLYILTDLLFKMGEKELILEELNEAVKQKIAMRQGLIKLREYIINHDKLPEYIS